MTLSAGLVVAFGLFLWHASRDDRLRELDERIESSLPKDRGIQVSPQIARDVPAVKVSLIRLDATDPAKARTRITIGGSEFFIPNRPWVKEKEGDMAVADARDRDFAPITAALRRLHDANPTLKGEIVTPRPFGEAVPHEDVIRVLDCFLEAGIKDVNFVGAPSPLPKANGARSVPSGR